MKNNSAKRIIVGMSGGVDSSVAALLLKQQGYAVAGLFMKNWEGDDTDQYCSASADAADAQAVCDQLQIELHRVNFANTYWERVFSYFLDEYRKGRTPNPDILCNKEIKFNAFLQHAQQLGADCIATGHYAQCHAQENQFQLLKGVDANKDQSYFLYALDQYQLAHALFPIGHLTKPAVRELASKMGFKNSAKKDSTGICFIGERRFKDFLSQYLPAQPGPIETDAGKVIGQHDGLMFYTLGQRQGIGIGGLKTAAEAPWYVLAKDLARNTLIVGQGHDHPRLFSHGLIAEQIHWIAGQTPALPLIAAAKTRYRQIEQRCIITALNEQQCRVTFTDPQRAVTPGQSVVFYQDEICLGGAVIVATE